jgi:hypothetical protein
MKTLFFQLTIISTFLTSCIAQSNKEQRQFYSKDFKWTITIPAGFDTVNAEKWNQMQNRGAEAIGKTFGEKPESRAKTIFVFLNDKFNYFESNYQDFDVTKDGDYRESCKNVNNILYQTLETQMKGAKLDSSFTTTLISGLVFQTFKMVVTFPKNNMVLKMYLFSRLFGKKEFSVNITAVDKQKEKEALDAWLNSRFEK